jgi:hypothetical protein
MEDDESSMRYDMPRSGRSGSIDHANVEAVIQCLGAGLTKELARGAVRQLESGIKNVEVKDSSAGCEEQHGR